MPDNVRLVEYQGRKIRAVEVRVESSDEKQSIYKLSDGSELRVRLAIANVFRALEEYTDDGDPVYVLRFTPAVATSTNPDLLKKK